MRNFHKPLQSNESPLAIQAAIEGLTVEQIVAREVFVGLGFSQEQATRLSQLELAPSEQNWNCLQNAMREIGWADDQVEIATEKFLNTIYNTVNPVLAQIIQPKKESS